MCRGLQVSSVMADRYCSNSVNLGQAMEIGAAAISFLIDTWEGHLTPPEAASIADRASRGCDPNMVRAAAELALSCLPHAHALNPNEIQRAILQCKEQSDVMLEHACLTVENAAKGTFAPYVRYVFHGIIPGGGVYPEVLFQVAKCWYELYVRHTPGAEQLLIDSEAPHDPMLDQGALVALIEPPGPPEVQMPPPPQNGPPVMASNGSVVVTTAPPPPYQHPAATTLAPLGKRGRFRNVCGVSVIGFNVWYVLHKNLLQECPCRMPSRLTPTRSKDSTTLTTTTTITMLATEVPFIHTQQPQYTSITSLLRRPITCRCTISNRRRSRLRSSHPHRSSSTRRHRRHLLSRCRSNSSSNRRTRRCLHHQVNRGSSLSRSNRRGIRWRVISCRVVIRRKVSPLITVSV